MSAEPTGATGESGESGESGKSGVGTGAKPGRTGHGVLDQLGEAMEPFVRLPVARRVQSEVPTTARAAVSRFPDVAALPRIGLALTTAYLPSATLRDLAKAGLSAGRVDSS
jgi:hypothetical protein